jgi:hypothetical protein
MNANWTDFNNAESQQSFDVIPKGTIVPVRMTIKPGGFDDHNRGWAGGYATQNQQSGSVYLNCEFVITEGKYTRRKVWSLIGLFSHKGPEWGNMGRSFVRGILNSSRGLKDKDDSEAAQRARRINGLGDLDGIEFLAKIDIEKDQHGEDKNTIKFVITPDHKEYQGFNAGNNTPAPAAHHPHTTQGYQQSAPQQVSQPGAFQGTPQQQAPQQQQAQDPAGSIPQRPGWSE